VGFFVKEEQATFGTSGWLYENNLVMYDRGQGYEWIQLLARRVTTCDTVSRFPMMLTTWGSWKEIHPNTELLSTRTGYDRDYSMDPYPQYSTNEDIYFITSYRSNAKPYNLYPPKSSAFILDAPELEQRFLFPQNAIGRAGAFAFTILNNTVNNIAPQRVHAVFHVGKYAHPVLQEMVDHAIVVAHSAKKSLSAAWLVTTNLSMNGTLWKKSFHLLNHSRIVNLLDSTLHEPLFGVDFSSYYAEGVFQVPANISIAATLASRANPASTNSSYGNCSLSSRVTVRFQAFQLPLFSSYWFTATAVFPKANILVENNGFRFESYDPEIIYQQPWRPWMIASLVVLSTLALVIISCFAFYIYHLVNRKRFKRLNEAAEMLTGSMHDEMRLLVQAGIIDPADLH